MAFPPTTLIRDSKPVVIVFVGWTDSEASGAVRSVLGMAEALASDFNFIVVTRIKNSTRGAADAQYSEKWMRVGCVDFCWMPVTKWGPAGVRQVLNKTPHDIVMLSGFFDREFTLRVLLARRFRRIPVKPTILSPYGELDSGALSIKALPKRAYLHAVRALGLLSDLWLHASDESELQGIAQRLPAMRGCFVASDVVKLRKAKPYVPSLDGVLRLIFLGRIVRKKNLKGALSMLASTRCRVTLDIYGPIEDCEYWYECKALIASLPQRASATYHGEVRNSQIEDVLARADLFFLPTLGENFCHAIFEALSCGVPVLISDRTPWRNLAIEHAGWELPLQQPRVFSDAIDAMAAMGERDREALRRGSRARAERFVARSDAVLRTRDMLEKALGRKLRQ